MPKRTSKGDKTDTQARRLSQLYQIEHFWGSAVGQELVTGYVMPYGASITYTEKGDWLCTVRGTDGVHFLVYFAGGVSPLDVLLKAAIMAFSPKTEWKPDKYVEGAPSLRLAGMYAQAEMRARKRAEAKAFREQLARERQLPVSTDEEIVGAEGLPRRASPEDV